MLVYSGIKPAIPFDMIMYQFLYPTRKRNKMESLPMTDTEEWGIEVANEIDAMIQVQSSFNM